MLNVGVAVVLGFFAAKMDEAKAKVAELGTIGLMSACEAYYLHPKSGGMMPTRLSDLVRPFGGPSYIRNGAADLLDPWGVEYKYATAVTEKGIPAAYVWTERVVNGKTKVFGMKPPPKKQ